MISDRVVIPLSVESPASLSLRRASLVFDEVYYTRPLIPVFAGGPRAIMDRVRQLDDSKYHWIEGFDWASDVQPHYRLRIENHPSGNFHELREFEAEGIVKPAPLPTISKGSPDTIAAWHTVSSNLLRFELKDERFLHACEVPSDWERRPLHFLPLSTTDLNGGDPRTDILVSAPTAWYTSLVLSELSFAAHRLNALPVVPTAELIRGLQARRGSLEAIIAGATNNSPAVSSVINGIGLGKKSSLQCRPLFGLLGNLFDDATIARLSVRDIVAIRRANVDARKALLSKCWKDIEEIASSSSSELHLGQLEDRIEVYIRDELIPALREFQSASKDIRDRLIGKLVVRSAEAIKHTALSGTAGGYIGTAVFGLSWWGIAAASAACSAAFVAPKALEDLQAAVIEAKRAKRSAMAYLAAVADAVRAK